MAAQNSVPISADLEQLNLNEGGAQSVEQKAHPQLLDTPKAVKFLVDTPVPPRSTLWLHLRGS